MEEQSKFAERILNQVADAVICVDPSGVIIRWNPACLVLFGYSAVELSIGLYLSIYGLRIGVASTLRWQKALRSFTAARRSPVPYTRADAGCTSR